MNTISKVLVGPILLTTLGALLSMDHLMGISFGRTWPILLIVYGLTKLAGRIG